VLETVIYIITYYY